MSNEFGVGKKQWRKWTKEAQYLFCDVYDAARDQGLFTHSEAKRVPAQHWDVLRWNFAWWVADTLSKAQKSVKKAA